MLVDCAECYCSVKAPGGCRAALGNDRISWRTDWPTACLYLTFAHRGKIRIVHAEHVSAKIKSIVKMDRRRGRLPTS